MLLGAPDRFDKSVGAGAVFGGNVASPAAYLLGLWAHESERTFCDKMITLQDKAWVEGAIRELCRSVGFGVWGLGLSLQLGDMTGGSGCWQHVKWGQACPSTCGHWQASGCRPCMTPCSGAAAAEAVCEVAESTALA